MDKNVVKNITVLSALCGVILAILALIPVVVKFAVFVLMVCICIFVILYMRKQKQLEIFTVKESILVGSLSGLVSYLAFSVLYLPLVFLLSKIFPMAHLGGLVLFLKLSDFGVVFMYTIFISMLSVIFNAFSSLLYYYVASSFEVVKDDKTFKLK